MTDYVSILKHVSGAEEVWEERRFSIYRNRRLLTVTISDQGPAAFSHRYMATVDGDQYAPAQSTGNPAATVEEALDNVHWWEFD